jgi:putative aminopeptidase FrvX
MELDLALLERLTRAQGPSGREDEVAGILAAAFAASGTEVRRDEMGNLFAGLSASHEDAPTVAVVAHMDEVGLVVRHIRADGFLLVDRIGGIGRRSLAGRHVVVQGTHGPVDAVVGVKSHHLTEPAEYYSLPSIGETFLDAGATSAAEAREMGIEVGSSATFAGSFLRLGRRDVCAKALDDRASCYAMVEMARRLKEDPARPRLLFIGSVREEFDFSGAAYIARTLDASFTVVLDVSPAVDTPDASGEGLSLGAGPALKVQDFHGRGPLAGHIASPQVVALVREVARSGAIQLQTEVRSGLATDSVAFVPVMGSARVACLSLPIRYTHSPTECMRLSDLEELIILASDLVIAAGQKEFGADEVELAEPGGRSGRGTYEEEG